MGQGAKFVPPDIPFQGQEAINAALPPTANALDFFRLYFTDEMVDLMVLETNRYADQYIQGNVLKPHSAAQNWVQTNREEMFAFIGLSVLMGVVYKPRIHMYWSTDEIFHTDIFPNVMSRDRYLLLLRFWHFADNTANDVTDPDRDRLFKVRQLTEMVRQQCRGVYSPARDLCVDESLLLFKGRLGFKQFIKTKRARFGIKLFELCSKSGILLDLMVYTGGHMSKELIPDPELLTSEKIPLTLMQPYLNKGHRLFLDNFYTSPRLALHLLDKQTTLVGTVRPNRRDFPVDLARADIERGQTKFSLSDAGVLAVKYRAPQDKANKKPKVVHVLSTAHGNNVAASAKKDKDGNAVMKPTCILDYNKSMGGVDLMDQQLDSLLVIRKSYKWYKKIVFRLLMQIMLSSHKLMQLKGDGHDFLKFVHDVVTQLLTFAPRLNRSSSAGLASAGLDSVARLTGRNHFPSKRVYQGRGADRSSKTKKCRVCAARGRRTPKGAAIETTWVCEACPSVPGLCVEAGCFKEYHTKFDYTK